MFFFIPIGHDELTLRGFPFATVCLIASLILVFSLTWGKTEQPDTDGAEASTRQRDTTLDVAIGREMGEIGLGDVGIRAESEPPAPPSIAAEGTPFSRRFGFVPSHRGIGLVTHMFLHEGVMSLLIGIVFLWVVAVKLESLWSKPVLVSLFVGGGIVSALVYGAITSSRDTPLLGSSGAIAALMGASLVRLGRSKVHYAYFVWMGLKPKYGTFDAPAYITPILWLVTMLGAHFLALTFFSTMNDLSFTATLGGFTFGVCAALAFRAFRLEERVLHRAEEVVIAPDDMPIVAFQKSAGPQPPRKTSFTAFAVTIESLDRSAIQLTSADEGSFEIKPWDVRVWTVGQIARTDGADAELLPGAALRAPCVLLALVTSPRENEAQETRTFVVDASRLKYGALLETPASTPKDAFFKLASKVNVLLPGAAFAGDRAKLREGTLPQHATLREFFSRLDDAAIMSKRH